MVRVADIGFATTKRGVGEVVTQDTFAPVAAAVSGVGRIVREKEERDAAAWSAKADADAVLAGEEALEEARVEAENPEDISNLFFDKFKERTQAIVATSPNKIASDKFTNRFETLRSSFGRQAINMQVRETQALRMMSLDDSINSYVNLARNTGNIDIARQGLESAFQDAESFTSPAELAKIRDGALSNLKGSYLDKLFEDGNVGQVRSLINDSEFNKDLNSQQVGAYRKAIKKHQDMVKVESAARQQMESIDFNPMNKNHVKALDTFYDMNFSESLVAGDPQAINIGVTIAKDKGVVPSSMVDMVKSSYTIGDKERLKTSYELIDQLDTVAPRALQASKIKDSQISEAKYYNNLLASGVDTDRAFELTDNAFHKIDEDILQRRRKEFNNILKEKDGQITGDDVEDLLDPGLLSFEPELREIAVPGQESTARVHINRINRIYEAEYLNHGDAELAKERAKEIFKQSTGVSKVASKSFGGSIMRHPPEKEFFHERFVVEGEDKTAAMLEQFLKKDLRDKGLPDNLDNIELVSDAVTGIQKERGLVPTYAIAQELVDGGVEIVGRVKFNLDEMLSVVDELAKGGSFEAREKKKQEERGQELRRRKKVFIAEQEKLLF